MNKQIHDLDTVDGHGLFMKQKWKQMAGFAWRKYLSEGRGAVVCDFRRASVSDSGLNVPTFYVAEDSDSLKKIGGWPNDEIAEMIQEYDPDQDVLFIFLRLDGEVFHYCATDELTPPLAGAQIST